MIKFVGWANSLNDESGEAFLAKKFINFKDFRKEIVIFGPGKKNYLGNYFSTFYGILLLWYWFFKGKRTVYINYLPFWNFFIFLLCPPKTLFGPITGSIQINNIKNFKSFIRKYFFPILYFISNTILCVRSDNIIFASNILKKNIFNNIKKKSLFNFVLRDIKINKYKYKKKFDYIIYFNKHDNKFFNHHKILINKLIKRKKKIIVFGDNINLKGVLQMGRVSKNKLMNYIKVSKYTISGDDNLLSLFNLECLEKNLKIIYNHKLTFQVPRKLKNNFIAYNYVEKKFI